VTGERKFFELWWHDLGAPGVCAATPRPRKAPWCGGADRTLLGEARRQGRSRATPRADELGGFPRFEMIHTVLEDFFAWDPCRTTITAPRHLHSLITRHRVSPIHRARSRLDRRHAPVAPNASATTAMPRFMVCCDRARLGIGPPSAVSASYLKNTQSEVEPIP
jgi:hypothetical protein